MGCGPCARWSARFPVRRTPSTSTGNTGTARSSSSSSRKATSPSASAPRAPASEPSTRPPATGHLWPKARRSGRSTVGTTCWSTRCGRTTRWSRPTGQKTRNRPARFRQRSSQPGWRCSSSISGHPTPVGPAPAEDDDVTALRRATSKLRAVTSHRPLGGRAGHSRGGRVHDRRPRGGHCRPPDRVRHGRSPSASCPACTAGCRCRPGRA